MRILCCPRNGKPPYPEVCKSDTSLSVNTMLRAEFHRLAAGNRTTPCREVGSAVCQVFDGSGRVDVGGSGWDLQRGDLFVVPSWTAVWLETDDGLDLFRFSDTPIVEKLGLTAHPSTASAGDPGTGFEAAR